MKVATRQPPVDYYNKRWEVCDLGQAGYILQSIDPEVTFGEITRDRPLLEHICFCHNLYMTKLFEEKWNNPGKAGEEKLDSRL